MDISSAPGGAAEPQRQVVQGGGQLPGVRGVVQGREADKHGQAPGCLLPDNASGICWGPQPEGLEEVEQEDKVFGLLQMGFLAGTLEQLRGQQLLLVVM